MTIHRVCTETGNQNSRTFPGLFKDYLHFSRSHFSLTVTHLTLLIRRISVPFKIINAFSFQARCFCLISALFIVSARYFCFCLSQFPLCKVSLPVAFDSYYLNQIEKKNTMAALPLTTAPHFVFYYRFCNSRNFYNALHPKKTVSIIFKDFL